MAEAFGYLAPELLEPNTEPRPYTDIYGLGVILYELLTGRPPFFGTKTPELPDISAAQDPVPPSNYNRDVKPPLQALCLRCLQKNRWRRFARAHDVATELRRLADD